MVHLDGLMVYHGLIETNKIRRELFKTKNKTDFQDYDGTLFDISGHILEHYKVLDWTIYLVSLAAECSKVRYSSNSN